MDDSKLDDIMVIDVVGEPEMAPPQSKPVKKVKTELSFKWKGFYFIYFCFFVTGCC